MPQKPIQQPCLINPFIDPPIQWQWHFLRNPICGHVLGTHPVAMPLKLTAQCGQQLRQSSVTLKIQRQLRQCLTNSSKDNWFDLLKSSVVCICYRVCSDGAYLKNYICTLYTQAMCTDKSCAWTIRFGSAASATHIPQQKSWNQCDQWPCFRKPSNASEIHPVVMPQNASSGHASESQPVAMPQKSIQWPCFRNPTSGHASKTNLVAIPKKSTQWPCLRNPTRSHA